jgi:hypothetical protein
MKPLLAFRATEDLETNLLRVMVGPIVIIGIHTSVNQSYVAILHICIGYWIDKGEY